MTKKIIKRVNPETGEVKRRYVKSKLPFKRGYFSPSNPHKYIGDLKKIEYRSSWELRLMIMFDTSDSVHKWSSEGTIIPYFSKADNKERRYYSDFTVEMINDDGSFYQVILEIKPLKQIRKPKAPLRKTEKSMTNYHNAIITHQVNLDKWESANRYCINNNIAFLLVYQNKNNTFTFINYDMYLKGLVRLDE